MKARTGHCLLNAMQALISNQVNLVFTNRYRDTWAAGIQAVCGKVIDLKPLVTHTFRLEQAVKALHLSASVESGSIKVQIVDDREIGFDDDV